MIRRRAIREALLVAACIVACLAPMPWLSMSAASLLVVFWPGYFLLRLLRPAQGAVGRAWIAMAVSLAVMPVLLSWLWQWSNDRRAVLAAVSGVDAVLFLLASLRAADVPIVPAMFRTKAERRAFALLIAWVGGCVFGFYWLPVAGERLVSSSSGDYVKHHAVMWSLERYPLPLHNVFCAAESASPYYYYEQFYLIPAAVRTMSGNRVSIAFAFGAAAAVVATVFVALVYLIARNVLASGPAAILAAACASVVGGWDALAAVIRWAVTGIPTIVVDSWAPVAWRIHNLMNSFIWCPQHVAAVAAFLLCAHLLQVVPRRRWWLIGAPAAATSVFGTSVYQAMIVFPAAAVYAIVEIVRSARTDRGGTWRWVSALVFVGLVTAVMTAARAGHYLEMNHRYEGGLTFAWERFDLAFIGRLVPPGVLANWLDAPWMLLIDFGVGAVACVLISGRAWRRLWRDAGMRLLMLAGLLGVALMWSVRSDVNRFDYGFRLAGMSAMVVAAVAAGFLAEGDLVRSALRRSSRWILLVALLLGLPVGLYEAPGLALRTLFERPADPKDTGAIRFIRDRTPADAVVQGDPLRRTTLPQLTDRVMGVLDPVNSHVNVFRPPQPERMQKAYEAVTSAFAADSAREAYEQLAAWGVTHVLVGTCELQRFEHLGRFRDERWFEVVYDDGWAFVCRLVPKPPSTSMALSGTLAR